MASIFVASLTYTVPIERIDEVLTDHLAFLKAGYEAGQMLAWGPCEPRERGLVFIRAASRTEAETIMAGDPFMQHGLARCEIIEWTPRFLGPGLEAFGG